MCPNKSPASLIPLVIPFDTSFLDNVHFLPVGGNISTEFTDHLNYYMYMMI